MKNCIKTWLEGVRNGRFSSTGTVSVRSILPVNSNCDESDKFLTLDNLNSKAQFRRRTPYEPNLIRSWTDPNCETYIVICKFRRANDLRNVSNGWWQPAARTAKSNEWMWWNFTSNALIGVSCCLQVLQIICIRQNANKYSRILPILTQKQTVTCHRIRLPLNKLRT